MKTKSLMVVKSDRGFGKSSLVAKWVKRFQLENPEIKVISHYVGCSGRSMDVTTFMQRCIAELREEYLKEGKSMPYAHLFGLLHEKAHIPSDLWAKHIFRSAYVTIQTLRSLCYTYKETLVQSLHLKVKALTRLQADLRGIDTLSGEATDSNISPSHGDRGLL